MNHVLDRTDVLSAEALVGHQQRCKFGAALDVSNGVLRSSALSIISFLQVAGIVKQDGQQTKPEESIGHSRFSPGQKAPTQQASHTKGSLQRVLEIVISRVDGLVILVFAG